MKLEIITALVVGALLLMLYCIIDNSICSSKARAMGVPSTWGPLQGCIIEPKPGLKVPLQNYRVL